MGTVVFNNAVVIGNFSKLSKRRPKNWIDKDYKILVPYKFKWRDKVGKVECDCKFCEEHHQPYYGFTWFHSQECSLMKYLKEKPQIGNLIQYWGQDLTMIAQTE
jgi:hypothetical protein